MPTKGLQELTVQELQAVHAAEQQGVNAAPAIQQRATNPDLKQKLQERTAHRQEQLGRLEQAIRAAGAEVRGEPNQIAQGILRTGEKTMNETEDPDLRDAGIIASGQIAIHYHIAAYGTLKAYAEALGNRASAATEADDRRQGRRAPAARLAGVSDARPHQRGFRVGRASPGLEGGTSVLVSRAVTYNGPPLITLLTEVHPCSLAGGCAATVASSACQA